MWRGRLIIAFVLLTISTVSGSSSNLNISELGQSFKYECAFNAAVGNSPDFQGLCFSVSTPGNKSQDLVCLESGAPKDSSGCLRVYPPLYDCCQKNIKQTYFHKRGDGSGEFVLVTKYGRISSCDDTNNYCKFTVSSKTRGLTSSQVICTIMSTGTAAEISSTIPPPLHTSIAHNKTEGAVTRTVLDSSPSPGATNHAEISSTIPPPLHTSIAHNKTEGAVTRTVLDSSPSPGATNHAAEISSTIPPPLHTSIAHNKTEGAVTRTVLDSSPSPGATNHAGSSSKEIMDIIPFSLVVYFVVHCTSK